MTWLQNAEALQPLFFPGKTPESQKNKIRKRVYKSREYKERKRKQQMGEGKPLEHQASMIYNKDGSMQYSRIIELLEGEEATPERMMQAHGLDPTRWQVVTYTNNYWDSQIKGGQKLLMYQSKLTVRPYKEGEISLGEVQDWFKDFETHYQPPKVNFIPQPKDVVLESNISDLHFGKLAWHGECGVDYDFKIASDLFRYAVDDIISRVKGRGVSRILFPIGNDFFNSDTVEGTTTKGTRQDNDVRWQKMFTRGMGLLIEGIDRLASIAPVDAFYVPGNHDEMASFYVCCALERHFHPYSHVDVDISPTPRKYRKIGNTLIGYSHGDEDKNSIHQVMQIEAREGWGQTLFHEMHLAHMHKEEVQEKGGVIVRRISTMSAPEAWHTKKGFVGSVRKTQHFLYDQEKGLTDILHSVVNAG